MNFSSLIIAALLQTSVSAVDLPHKQHVRRIKEHQHTHGPHKHQPRGERSSSKVTYFTMGGQDKKKKENHQVNTDERESRIVGGSQSSPGEFPYYVDLGGCGGSLIAPNIVLTAAHCGNYQGENVIVGAYRGGSTENNAVSVSVAADIPHPNYNDFTLANDFRLLRLSQDVTVAGSNVVLSINNQFSSPSANQVLTVMGLGDTTDGNEQFPDFLRDVDVPAIASSTCNQANSYNGDVENDTMFCAGFMSGQKDSCQGDSGGPIVIRNGNQHIQVGVVSWGDGCAQANKPGVYARVSSAFNWIENVVCDQWQANASFCGSTGTPPSPTPPAPTPTPPTPTPPAPTPPSGGNGGCPSGQMEMEFTIRTDDWGEETSWEAVNSSGQTIASGSNYESDRQYVQTKCIASSDCYALTIYDDFGDGLSEGGSNPGFQLSVDGQVVEERGGFDFEYDYSINFGSCNGSGGGGSGGGGGGSGGGSSSSCLPVTLNVLTDSYGYETDLFLLTDMGDLVWNANGFADNQTYQFTACIPSNECATLDIFDEWGDGIESPGFIKLTVDGTTYFDSGDIGGGIVFRIGDNC